MSGTESAGFAINASGQSVPHMTNRSNEHLPAKSAAKSLGEYLDLERHCSFSPRDRPARRRMLQLFFALGQPADLPGKTFALKDTGCTPRVAVVTPYYQEPLQTLKRCHLSVQTQTIKCSHIFIADGYARSELDAWDARHLRISVPRRDFGDTPRRLGGEAAVDEKFDAILYLDADNWLRPRHAESLLALSLERRVSVCHSARTLHRADGTVMPLLQQGDNYEHVDTSCIFLTSAAFELLSIWGRWPRELSLIDDRLFWQAIQARRFDCAFTGALTTCYEASHRCFYQALKEVPPNGTRPDIDLGALFAWFKGLSPESRAEIDEVCGFPVAALVTKLQTTEQN